MPLEDLTIRLTLFALLAAAAAPVAARAEDWPPVSPEELKMTSELLAPGAPAIILDRQVDRDDRNIILSETVYYRIKILTEEGRDRANVEIPFYKGTGEVKDLQARTMHPDGSITPFSGQLYDKQIAKAGGMQYLAKVFTLPDVHVGDVIEYRYTMLWNTPWLFGSDWILSEDLFTKHARFSLSPRVGRRYGWRWKWQNLPPGTEPKEDDQHVIRLEIRNVQAFQEEEYMPPKSVLEARVDFSYAVVTETDPDKFWEKEGRRLDESVEAFVNKPKAMEEAIAEIVSPGDAPDIKLRKIYERVQKLRNLSYEQRRTAQEWNREKLKQEENVESVWKHGYGNGAGLTWLFLALARAAGFEAWPVLVSDRSNHFFNKQWLDAHQLNANAVLVRLNGQDSYFDPGSKFTPYGLLPWHETGVPGMRLDKDGGAWTQTPSPSSDASTVERKANLKLGDSGALEGELKVTYRGLEALWRRQDERNDDPAGRKKFLEDEVREWIPTSIEVELRNEPDWESSAETLEADFELKVPGWATSAGRRLLVPAGLFSAPEKHAFEHAHRVNPLYFRFSHEKNDDISVGLPSGWHVETLPADRNTQTTFCGYDTRAENKNGTLHLTRRLAIHGTYLKQAGYQALRSFFQTVRAGDDLQIILQAGPAAAAN